MKDCSGAWLPLAIWPTYW